jgi:hypothetical protein
MRLRLIRWHDNATIYHRASAATALAQAAAKVTTADYGNTWRVTWGKA